ncbi:hypothetical protein [Aliikangiella sp. G2MR2-5]|uniref:hypothetical protein n=1 Tax=Aliikangiella sp. G2MR2-5 TaxID=2788943 RepID=UPI0018AC68FE|nr:hypothetical protein [Aliikangiella sp. G2MR2-5]
MNNNKSAFTKSFEDVQAQEDIWVEKRREVLGQDKEAPLVGLALSGGGIRSATFNLGLLQALSRTKLLRQVDLLSSVSGGGYIASCFNWIRNHVSAAEASDFTDTPVNKDTGNGGKETVLDWLRGHGNYLIAGKGFSYWQLIASIIAGTLLNLIVLVPLFVWVISILSADWSASLGWPVFLIESNHQLKDTHDGFLVIMGLGHLSLLLYLVCVVAFALTGLIPSFRRLTQSYFFRRNMGRLLSYGFIATLIGLIPVVAGLEHWVRANFEEESAAEFSKHLTYLLPILTGLFSLFQARPSKQATGSSGAFASLGLFLLMYGFFVLIYHWINSDGLIEQNWFWYWSGLSVLLALTSDVNAISMHSYYRSRLALAYMPEIESNKGGKTDPVSAMDFKLASMSPDFGGPLPIVNTTINTSSSKKQKLRSREGANFILTPLYCGASNTGFRATEDFVNGDMALSTAFSVSGAAVDPNTYATNSRPVAFLMALLNFRLGYWTDNPDPEKSPRKGRAASWYRLMLREMFAVGLNEHSPQIHLSDGGHFENLGLYELLRRRCRYIIASDAGADLNNTLADLGKAIQRARADFDVEIDIDVSTIEDEQNICGCACRIGNIYYADGSRGQLLYVKSQLQKALSADVYAYWRNNPTFPDQSTADQFFDEWQFDSYRQLGKQIGLSVFQEHQTIADVFAHMDSKKT